MKPYYEADGITIYHGDALDILPSLPRVDAVITDPPYAIPTVVAQGRDVTRNVGDLSIIEAAMRLYFQAATERLLSNIGRIFVFCDGTSYPVMFRVLYGAFSTALLVWDKGQIGMGREFRKSHELILHGWQRSTPIFEDGNGWPDVLKFAPIHSSGRVHPAEKPLELVMALVRPCGRNILDPFMGSGTTLVAAKDLGRRAVGIEIEERYCEIAARRLSQGVLKF